MSEEIVKQPAVLPPELASVISPDSSVHLVATTPAEMTQAQGQLTRWFTLKVAAHDAEAKELAEAVVYAKAHKWSYRALQTQHNKALARRLFYDKCRLASEQGFCLIPNIPIDVFAIRVARESPTAGSNSITGYSTPDLPYERPDYIPAGEGDYKSPSQLVRRWETKEKNAKGEDVTRKWIEADDFDKVQFPMIAARPVVMNATQQAMAYRIFDQIGVSPQRARSGDPLIIGQIVERVDKWGNPTKAISFLLAWNVDLRTL